MHPLKAWLAKNGKTAKRFAGEIGVRPVSVFRYMRDRRPSVTVMARIRQATNNELSSADFDPPVPAASRKSCAA